MNNTYNNYPKRSLNTDLINSWLDANFNVCLIGKHGTGKTQQIKEAFGSRFGVDNWMYLCGSTTDPFIDLIGIPSVEEDSNGEKRVEMVRPKRVYDNIEAIFIDEINRAKPHVRNALMELIQFKSINGEKLPNLKVIWTAINPSHEETREDEDGDAEFVSYDVEQLDPAQLDRFHVVVRTHDDPSAKWFFNTHGEVGKVLVDWYKEQSVQVKRYVTPRRLEYVITAHNLGVDISNLLPKGANITQLQKALNALGNETVQRLQSIMGKKKELKKFFDSMENQEECLDFLIESHKVTRNPENNFKGYFGKNDTYKIVAEYYPKERVSQLATSNKKFKEYLTDIMDHEKCKFSDRVDSIMGEIVKSSAAYVGKDAMDKLAEYISSNN